MSTKKKAKPAGGYIGQAMEAARAKREEVTTLAKVMHGAYMKREDARRKKDTYQPFRATRAWEKLSRQTQDDYRACARAAIHHLRSKP